MVGVAAGRGHTVAWTESGELWSWGQACNGATGHGHTGHGHKWTPFLVQGMVGRKVVAAAAGEYHTAVVTSEGELWTFGGNSYGHLGLGNTYPDTYPQKLPQRVSIHSLHSQPLVLAHH